MGPGRARMHIKVVEEVTDNGAVVILGRTFNVSCRAQPWQFLDGRPNHPRPHQPNPNVERRRTPKPPWSAVLENDALIYPLLTATAIALEWSIMVSCSGWTRGQVRRVIKKTSGPGNQIVDVHYHCVAITGLLSPKTPSRIQDRM